MPTFQAHMMPCFFFEAEDEAEAKKLLESVRISIVPDGKGRLGIYGLIEPSKLAIDRTIRSLPVEWMVAGINCAEDIAMESVDDEDEASA